MRMRWWGVDGLVMAALVLGAVLVPIEHHGPGAEGQERYVVGVLARAAMVIFPFGVWLGLRLADHYLLGERGLRWLLRASPWLGAGAVLEWLRPGWFSTGSTLGDLGLVFAVLVVWDRVGPRIVRRWTSGPHDWPDRYDVFLALIVTVGGWFARRDWVPPGWKPEDRRYVEQRCRNVLGRFWRRLRRDDEPWVYVVRAYEAGDLGPLSGPETWETFERLMVEAAPMTWDDPVEQKAAITRIMDETAMVREQAWL